MQVEVQWMYWKQQNMPLVLISGNDQLYEANYWHMIM